MTNAKLYCGIALLFVLGCSRESELSTVAQIPSSSKQEGGLTKVKMCGGALSKPEDELSLAKIEADALETVFRAEFVSMEDCKKRKIGSFFLQICEHQPPGDFLARFKDLEVLVKACSDSFSVGSYRIDKQTSQPGMTYSITNVRWLTPDDVEFECAMSGNTFYCSHSKKYCLELRNGEWIVKKTELLLIE